MNPKEESERLMDLKASEEEVEAQIEEDERLKEFEGRDLRSRSVRSYREVNG